MNRYDLLHNWTQNLDTNRWECACLISLPHPRDGYCPNKIEALRKALAPMDAIAAAYENGDPSDALVSGPDGTALLTLADVHRIRNALMGDAEGLRDIPLGIRLAVEEYGIKQPWTWTPPEEGCRLAKVWAGDQPMPALLICRCGASGLGTGRMEHTTTCGIPA